jgi:hypothetical protein
MLSRLSLIHRSSQQLLPGLPVKGIEPENTLTDAMAADRY